MKCVQYLDQKDLSYPYYRWLVLFLLLGIVFYLVIRTSHIKRYDILLGVVTEKENIVTLVPVETLQRFLKQDQVIIEGTVYSYQVERITDELIEEGGHFYKKIYLQVNLPRKWLLPNNTLSMKTLVKEQSVWHIVKSCFKEEGI